MSSNVSSPQVVSEPQTQNQGENDSSGDTSGMYSPESRAESMQDYDSELQLLDTDTVGEIQGDIASQELETPPRRSVRYRPPRHEWSQPPYTPTDFRPQVHVTESAPKSEKSKLKLLAVDLPLEPRTFSEAMNSSESLQWREAAQEEYNSLMENNTWILEAAPPGRTPIEGKWIFRRKVGPEGYVDRYKARFVVRGFKQVAGIDYIESKLYSFVVRNQSIRFFLALTAEWDMFLEHMDVCTAFLNGELKEIVYIKQLEGFEDPNFPDKLCRLLKALYGLKQSSKAWFEKIDEFLLAIRFKLSDSNPNLYVKDCKDGFAMLALYVDDLVLAAATQKLLDQIKYQLIERFKMKNLGNLTYCLGVQVLRNRSAGSITIHQSKYITEIVRRFNLTEAKSLSTPMVTSLKLSSDGQLVSAEEKREMSKFRYRQAVGCLIYLNVWTKPDISKATQEVAKYSNNPGKTHWDAVKRIYRCIQYTKLLGLTYQGSGTGYLKVVGWSDADWAADLDD